MTGLEIMEGLSYVDEKYIQEAETATLGRNTQWMKVLSAVACLCILVVGAYAYRQANMKSESAMDLESAAGKPAAAAPQEPAADATEAGAPLAPADESLLDAAVHEETESANGELHHVPNAKLRIVSFNQEGFTAAVEESEGCDFLAAGMQVQVTIDASEVPASEESDGRYGGITLPEEGMLVTVENGAYDASANTLYVVGITLEE